ncbi:MAG: hypothetical protein AB1766_00375, partial [Pseudomonadota bacterium]
MLASERGVRAAIQDLKNLGLIKIEHRHDAQGRNLSNLYYLNLSLPMGARGDEGRGQNLPPGGKNEDKWEGVNFATRQENFAPESKNWNLKIKEEPKRGSRGPAPGAPGPRGAPPPRGVGK